MAGRIEALLLLIGIPVLLVLGLTVASDRVLRRSRPVPVDARFPGLRGAWGITERSRWVGLVLATGICLAALPLVDATGNLSVVLAPALAGLVCVLTVLVGQRLVGRRVAGEAAGIEVRRVADYLNRGYLLLGVVLTLLFLVAVAVGLALAGPDADSIGVGSCHDERGASMPCLVVDNWYGPAYALPALAAVALLLVAALGALRVIAARPRNGAEPSIVVLDDEVRRRAATVVAAATCGGLVGSLAVALWCFHSAASNIRLNAELDTGVALPQLASWQVSALGWSVVACVAVALWCLARVIRPRANRPVDAVDSLDPADAGRLA